MEKVEKLQKNYKQLVAIKAELDKGIYKSTSKIPVKMDTIVYTYLSKNNIILKADGILCWNRAIPPSSALAAKVIDYRYNYYKNRKVVNKKAAPNVKRPVKTFKLLWGLIEWTREV